MQSDGERRLHPLSFAFLLGAQVRQYIIPLVLYAVTASYVAWGFWLLPFVAVYTIVAILRTLSFRYRYGDAELVIRTGFFFRNERHVPYQRIHNIDSSQSVFHRMLGVAEVRIETAGGQEPEATMRVLPIPALEEMRRRVFAPSPLAAIEEPKPAATTALRLGVRELLLCGLIQSRGMVVVAAALGLVWEFGLFDRLKDAGFGRGTAGRGLVRRFLLAFFADVPMPGVTILLTVAGALAFLLIVRLLSMAWTAIRLYGFTIVRTGGDLRTDFGLVTRVSATIPLNRIQTLTILEGPFHRLFRRASIRVATAGSGGTGEEQAARREWLAPLIRAHELSRFLGEVLPGLNLGAVPWQPVHPKAFRRVLKRWLIVAALVVASVIWMTGWWAVPLAPILIAFSILGAARSVAHLRHACASGAVWFRSGWIWRSTTVARLAKVQAVTLGESPFDRRSAMGSVRVDTAGSAAHPIDIPYLDITDARNLHRRLAGGAARTVFRW